ncbi:MAG: signal peptidase I [Desulfococcaceae bacterium]
MDSKSTPMATDKQDEKGNEPAKKGALRENIEAILIAIVLALFIRTFVVQAFKIPSGSMKETLQIGDHILVNKFIYGVKVPFTRITAVPLKDPKRGDVIVFKFPEEPEKDFIVPEGTVFVMGDNRDHSYDSRFWGPVDLESVKGKAFIIYWSWNRDDFDVRWGRIGHLLE